MAKECPKDYVIEVGSGTGDLPDHISFSQMSMVERCPQQYEFRYLEGLVEPPSMGLSQGTIGHEMVELQHRHKIDTGKNLSTSDIEDAFNDRWKKGHAIGFGRGKDAEYVPWSEVERDTGKVKKARIVSHACTVTYHEDVAVNMVPIEVEREYKLPFLRDRVFVGYADAIDRYMRKFERCVDTKFVGRKYDSHAANSAMQLASYAWAHLTAEGSVFDRVAFHVIVKKATPEVQDMTAHMTKTRIAAFLWWADAQLAVIDSGRFVGRVGPHCNWCGYRHRCPWISGRGFGNVPTPKITRLSVGAT